MSSGRANASARNRRAGGAELNPQQQQRGPPQQPQAPPKLSVSDAIGLISLRLGKVEGMVQNIQVDQLRNGDSGMELNENSRIIDDNVFRSIVARLDVLEKNQKALMDNQTTLSNSMKSLASKTPSLGGGQVSQTIVKDVSDEKLASVNENIEVIHGEITLVKDLLMKLQNFTMETNQKLLDIVLDQGREDYTEHNNAMIFEEDSNGTNLDILGYSEHMAEILQTQENVETLNMSDLLKTELSNIDIGGEEISQEL